MEHKISVGDRVKLIQDCTVPIKPYGKVFLKGWEKNPTAKKFYKGTLGHVISKKFNSFLGKNRCEILFEKELQTRWVWEELLELVGAQLIILKNKKSVQQIDLEGNVINEYSSIKEAANKCGLTGSNISNALRGKQKTAGGYVWKYK